MLFGYFCTVSVASRKKLRGTDLILGLDHLTGLESILPPGLPMDVLYICSKEKKGLCQASSKGLLVGQIQLGLTFSSCQLHQAPPEDDQTHD